MELKLNQRNAMSKNLQLFQSFLRLHLFYRIDSRSKQFSLSFKNGVFCAASSSAKNLHTSEWGDEGEKETGNSHYSKQVFLSQQEFVPFFICQIVSSVLVCQGELGTQGSELANLHRSILFNFHDLRHPFTLHINIKLVFTDSYILN